MYRSDTAWRAELKQTTVAGLTSAVLGEANRERWRCRLPGFTRRVHEPGREGDGQARGSSGRPAPDSPTRAIRRDPLVHLLPARLRPVPVQLDRDLFIHMAGHVDDVPVRCPDEESPQAPLFVGEWMNDLEAPTGGLGEGLVDTRTDAHRYH